MLKGIDIKKFLLNPETALSTATPKNIILKVSDSRQAQHSRKTQLMAIDASLV